ncbi:HAD-IIB family hydrolase [Candidatus Parcubacteria bacterium]|nr:HAD-IIB family hydrolase [Candidatus Parcubacteria bacterium]
MIIVCDLDRTLVPNGAEEYDGSLEEFYERVSGLRDAVLVYATGRNLELFKEAEKEYGIRKPDYFIGSVGTEVYKNQKNFFTRKNKLVAYPEWNNYVKDKHPNWDRELIVQDIDEILNEEEFYLQEESVQNENKISYYLRDEKKSDNIIQAISEYINQKQIRAEVVYSFDPHKNLGLVDVLPKDATKLGSLEFLIEKLGESPENVVYCGDSGNDLLPLTSGIKSVLVKNARADVKEKAMQIVEQKGVSDKLYIAKGGDRLNGNYSSGVIEGLEYFGFLK